MAMDKAWTRAQALWERATPLAQTIAESKKFQYAGVWTPVGVALWLPRRDAGGNRNTTETDLLIDAIFITTYTFACLVFVLAQHRGVALPALHPRRRDGYAALGPGPFRQSTPSQRA